MSPDSTQGWLLLTNDDGIEAVGMKKLVQKLNSRGHKVVVFAPKDNHSATGMRINLMKPIKWRHRDDLFHSWSLSSPENVKLLELEGSPCDTMIVSLDGGLQHILPDIVPRLVVSGVNLGPNMSQDSYHSGTMGAAREAGLYGMPAIASSLASFDETNMDIAIDATVEFVERVLEFLPMVPNNLRRPNIDFNQEYVSNWPSPDSVEFSNANESLRSAFFQGDLMLNLNIPTDWAGQFTSTRLGMRWYRDAISIQNNDSHSTATFTIGAASIDHTQIDKSDCDAVEVQKASISCLPTWPQTHPLAVDGQILKHALEEDSQGYPAWFNLG